MTDVPELGRIEKGDIRKTWPNEAGDFTPWLAEHISELGEALGLDLELQGEEAPVGGFSLDLLASESSGAGRTVIIENQLETTDHRHLGQLLTYAGGCEAGVVIWVAREFRDEHRQALDWLNQHTDENADFFGVVIEVWRIGDSLPAPHFNVVAAPNEWRSEAVDRVRRGNISDKEIRYKSFFQGLMDTLREKKFTNARRAQPRSSYFFSSGHGRRFSYCAIFSGDEKFRVELYIDSSDRDWNKNSFDQLKMQQESIESELGESLEWQRLEKRRACRIAVSRPGSIDDDPDTLEETRSWAVEKILDFKRIFGPHLDELTK